MYMVIRHTIVANVLWPVWVVGREHATGILTMGFILPGVPFNPVWPSCTYMYLFLAALYVRVESVGFEPADPALNDLSYKLMSRKTPFQSINQSMARFVRRPIFKQYRSILVMLVLNI